MKVASANVAPQQRNDGGLRPPNIAKKLTIRFKREIPAVITLL
jgi:hypothetical protein